MTQDKIIRMAREAGFHIENWSFGERVSVYESGKTIDITNELKDFAALVAAHEREKQAEQEPVAWYSVKGGFNTCGEGKPLYAAPVRTKDLTDDEIMQMVVSGNGRLIDFARAVIAADREKNK